MKEIEIHGKRFIPYIAFEEIEHAIIDMANKIYDELKYDFNVYYEEKDAIGKRYRRMDAIGTPFCITVDHDSLNDNTVTLRYRDTMEQERVPVSELRRIIDEKVNFRTLLSKI